MDGRQPVLGGTFCRAMFQVRHTSRTHPNDDADGQAPPTSVPEWLLDCACARDLSRHMNEAHTGGQLIPSTGLALDAVVSCHRQIGRYCSARNGRSPRVGRASLIRGRGKVDDRAISTIVRQSATR